MSQVAQTRRYFWEKPPVLDQILRGEDLLSKTFWNAEAFTDANNGTLRRSGRTRLEECRHSVSWPSTYAGSLRPHAAHALQARHKCDTTLDLDQRKLSSN